MSKQIFIQCAGSNARQVEFHLDIDEDSSEHWTVTVNDARIEEKDLQTVAEFALLSYRLVDAQSTKAMSDHGLTIFTDHKQTRSLLANPDALKRTDPLAWYAYDTRIKLYRAEYAPWPADKPKLSDRDRDPFTLTIEKPAGAEMQVEGVGTVMIGISAYPRMFEINDPRTKKNSWLAFQNQVSARPFKLVSAPEGSLGDLVAIEADGGRTVQLLLTRLSSHRFRMLAVTCPKKKDFRSPDMITCRNELIGTVMLTVKSINKWKRHYLQQKEVNRRRTSSMLLQAIDNQTNLVMPGANDDELIVRNERWAVDFYLTKANSNGLRYLNDVDPYKVSKPQPA